MKLKLAKMIKNFVKILELLGDRLEVCVSVFCPHIHIQPLGWSQKVKTFFSESSHVAYLIKGNGVKTTMQAHSLS